MGISRLRQMIQRAKTTLLRTITVQRYLAYPMKACRNLVNTAKSYLSKRRERCLHLDQFITHAKDLPYYNWAQLHDYPDDSVHLLLKPNGKSKCKKCFAKAYEKIARSIIEVQGYPEQYIAKVNALAEIRSKEIEYWITGDRFITNEIRILESQYAMLFEEDKGEKVTMWQSWNSVEKALGFALDPKQESVLRFHERRETLIREAKEHQAEAQRIKDTKHQGIQSMY